MKKNFTSTLVMLGVLSALIGWYALYEGKYKTESKEVEELTKKFVSFETDQVTEFKLFRLKNQGKENTSPSGTPVYDTIEFKKTGPNWFIVSPIQSKGDDTSISSLLSAVCSAKQERVVDEKPSDLSVYGLKDPTIKILLKKDANSPSQEVWIGNDTPVAYSVYVKTLQSEGVFKTSRSLKGSLDKDLLNLRNKDVVDINRNDINEVEIQTPKQNIVVSRSGNNLKEEWTLSRENLLADLSEWNKVFTSLIELKGMKVVAEKTDNPTLYGLNNPIAKITFTKSDKTRSTLRIGKVKSNLYVKADDKDPIFEIDKAIEEKVNTPSSQYQNKHIANFDRFEVKKIKLLRGDASLELSKTENSEWKFIGDPNTKVDSSQIDTFLTKLQDSQTKKYLTQGSKQNLDHPSLTILLFENGGQGEKQVLNLSMLKVSPNLVIGKNPSIPFQFEIATEDFNKINVFKQTLIKTDPKHNEAEKLQKKS